MLQVVAAMAVFTTVVLLLAIAVLLVRQRLVPERQVTISLNQQRELQVASGDRLLWTLADHGVYLPAACGGRGSCGQCRLRVISGGGPLLPTERNHISGRDAALGERLACMVTVREDLQVSVPADILEARRLPCTLRSTRFLAPYLKELTLALPTGEDLNYEAGDYVLLEAPTGEIRFADFEVPEPYLQDWARLRNLRVNIEAPTLRAYSLASHPAEMKTVTLVVRIATPPHSAPPDTPPGRASSYLFNLRQGASITLSGPFGSFHTRDTEREMIFIGGGAGIAPMRSMILDLLVSRQSRRKISFWYGARSLRELCYRDEFEALARDHDNFSYQVALSEPGPDDRWQGPTGLIHQVVYETYLEGHPAPEEAEYYLCGPPLMSGAVVGMLEDLGVDRDSILFDDFGT
jgi:Na+-transporting NADH:ubiquinone oxidoreductase subunit F